MSQNIINMQDEKLNLISNYVSQLKNTSIAIGDTLDDHNNELDNLKIDMDNTTENINNTTNKVVRLNKSSKSNFCILASLFILIDVMLVVIYFSV